MRRVVVIEGHYNGPPRSANGGYACGVVAEGVDGTAAARLLVPPPLDRPMVLEGDGRSSRLLDGDTLVGEAFTATLDLALPTSPSLDEAREAQRRYVGFEQHQFDTCYVCGPKRKSGDGLQIFPGHVDKSGVVASVWIPEESLRDETGDIDRRHVWAALDCPSYFAIGSSPPAVLGQLTVEIDRLPRIGEALVVMGWAEGSEGRKHRSGSALLGEEGEIVARAAAIWIEPKGGGFA